MHKLHVCNHSFYSRIFHKAIFCTPKDAPHHFKPSAKSMKQRKEGKIPVLITYFRKRHCTAKAFVNYIHLRKHYPFRLAGCSRSVHYCCKRVHLDFLIKCIQLTNVNAFPRFNKFFKRDNPILCTCATK